MSGPSRIDELLADPDSDVGELSTLALLALWVDRAHVTATSIGHVLTPERAAKLAYALGMVRGEVELAMREYVGSSKGELAACSCPRAAVEDLPRVAIDMECPVHGAKRVKGKP